MRFLISDSTPESPRWRASVTQNSNRVENYLDHAAAQSDVITTALAGVSAELSASDHLLASVSVWE